MYGSACGRETALVIADVSRRTAGAATMVVGVVVTWVAVTDAVRGSLLLAAAIAGGLAAVTVLSRPRGALVALLVLGATVLPDRWGAFSVAGVRSDLVELLAFLMMGVWVLGMTTGRFAAPGFVGPWVLLLAGAVTGLAVGHLRGAPVGDLLGEGKALAFYLLPLVFTALFATASQQALLERWLLRIATVGSVVVLLAAGTGLELAGGLRTGTVETLGSAVDAQRIRTPLLALLVVGTLVVAARLMTRTGMRADPLRLGLYLTVIALSFNRSTWVPLALAVALLAQLRPGARVPGRGLRVAIAGVVTAVALSVAAGAGALGATGSAAAARVGSTLNPSVLAERSYEDRQRETEVAFSALARSPLVGVGVARPYGARRQVYLDNPPRLVFVDRRFIHNTYLAVWLQLGLLGVLATGWLSVSITREAIRARSELPAALAARHVAAALSLLVFGLAALLQTSFAHRPTILGLSCALALLQRPRSLSAGDATRWSGTRHAIPA
jgi:O-antigen ligase